ncbi:MAG: DUF6512 family protein [Protaetiibacter sp.]
MTEQLLWVNLMAIIPLSIVGSLLHFAYDWSRHNRVVAIVAAVNESYWEHIKIALWPVFVWFLVQFALGGWSIPGFVPAATIALYSVPVSMIAIVFGYKRLVGRNILWVDIAAFFVTVAVSVVVFALVAAELAASGWTIAVSVVFLLVLALAFARYTHQPPSEPDFFVDPTNARYGLDAHPD